MATKDERYDWALIGAKTRLAAIEQERAAIFKAFPGLRRASVETLLAVSDAGDAATTATSTAGRPRKRRVLTAAWKAKIAAATKKRWADAKKQGKSRL